MSKLNALKKFLGDRPHDYEMNLLVFSQLDQGELVKEFRLEDKGRERGEEHLPAADAITMDSVETNIITRFETEKHKWHDSFQNHLGTFHQRLAALNIQRHFTSVRTAARQAIGEFKAEILKRQNDLTLDRQNVVDSRTHLAKFKSDNSLIRPPNYPDSKYLHLGIILAICLIETTMNGFLLAIGDEFGFLGGGIQAFLISVLNVGVSFLIGRHAVPEFNHVKYWRRSIGYSLLSLYGIFVLILNLFVAHYRDAILSGVDKPSQYVINTFPAWPMAIHDFQSWIMVGIGCLFAFIALLDGYRFDDRYPGYGREARQHRRLYDDYIAKVDDAVNALLGIRDDAVQVIQDIRQDLNKRRNAHDAILTNRVRFINQFSAHMDYLETVANNLLEIYRTANRKARAPDLCPPYFNQRWAMLRPNETIQNPPSLSPESLEAAIKETDKALEKSINELYDAFDRSLPDFKRIDDLN